VRRRCRPALLLPLLSAVALLCQMLPPLPHPVAVRCRQQVHSPGLWQQCYHLLAAGSGTKSLWAGNHFEAEGQGRTTVRL
jgi:hypothetical protein